MADFSLYLVTDPQIGGGPDEVAAIVAAAIDGGVTVVQLRDKDADEPTFRERARELLGVCAPADVPLFLNDRIDIALELGTHLHIGQGDTPYVQARRRLPETAMIGLSIENRAQLDAVLAESAAAGVRPPDVIGIGPVQDTSTKPEAAPALGVAGVAAIAAAARSHGIDSVAIGGVNDRTVPALAHTPVSGICVVSAIMGAADPAHAARTLLESFRDMSALSPTRPRVLSIAGTDPTGGAGVQADLKSIAAAGGFGMSVVTSLVAQNTHGVRAIHTPPLEFLREQLESVFSDVSVDAVKLGMLGDAATVELVRDWLDTHPHGPVVLDPVMIATSGDRLLDASAEAAMRELATSTDVVTPNIPELAVLCDTTPATTMDQAVTQAQGFARDHDTIVIVKGGHLSGRFADNAVVRPDGTVHRVPNLRVDTTNTHGTGCSLSSSLATRIAGGQSLEAALEWSTRWLNEALRGADGLQVGIGNGPVDHSRMGQRMLAAADTTPWTHLRHSGATGAGPDDLLPAPTTASPAPRIAAAGPYTRALWAASGDVIDQILASDFITGLGSGSLPVQDFAFYIDQDAQYLRQYSRALAALGATAPDPGAQVAWAQSSAECLVVEAELHRSYMGGEAGSAASPVTMAYTDFLVARAYSEDYVVGAAAVLPCYWLYAEIGLELAEQNHEGHPYRAWLGTYSGADFIEGTRAAIARVEAAFEAAGPAQRVAAARAFLSASVHEREFFDQATRAGWL